MVWKRADVFAVLLFVGDMHDGRMGMSDLLRAATSNKVTAVIER